MPLDPKVELLKECEVSTIVNVIDMPFVDALYSRMSLSQPGENDAIVRDQAQAHLLRNQAYLESKEVVCDLTQDKSFGRVHFRFMDLSNGQNPRRPEVVKVSDDSQHVFAKLELARQRASTTMLATWRHGTNTLDLPY